MPVPHTRPISLTVSGTRADLIESMSVWKPETQAPANVLHLVEHRLDRARAHRSRGWCCSCPHYLSDTEYPDAAVAALSGIAAATGLIFPTDALREEGREFAAPRRRAGRRQRRAAAARLGARGAARHVHGGQPRRLAPHRRRRRGPDRRRDRGRARALPRGPRPRGRRRSDRTEIRRPGRPHHEPSALAHASSDSSSCAGGDAPLAWSGELPPCLRRLGRRGPRVRPGGRAAVLARGVRRRRAGPLRGLRRRPVHPGGRADRRVRGAADPGRDRPRPDRATTPGAARRRAAGASGRPSSRCRRRSARRSSGGCSSVPGTR